MKGGYTAQQCKNITPKRMTNFVTERVTQSITNTRKELGNKERVPYLSLELALFCNICQFVQY